MTEANLNPHQQQFVQDSLKALTDGRLRKLVFSRRESKKQKFQSKFELVDGGKKSWLEYSDSSGDEARIDVADTREFQARLTGAPTTPFHAATLYCDDGDFHYAQNRKGESRLYRTKASIAGKVRTHNKAKNYVLSADRPYLRGLGVTDGKGRVVKKYHPKFRQIANFVEIIHRDLEYFVSSHEAPISLLDLGCGKGYLTFAAYDYLQAHARHAPQGRGVDLKKDVIDTCAGIADKLNWDGLKFIASRIEPDNTEQLDILIALHACDTATDDALALGVKSNMRFFFCAPCCQAEIAAQLTPADGAFRLINHYPLMKRRQADIVTDTCRALLLQAVGYEVKFLEFTPLEHTAKNVMLVGKRRDQIDRAKGFQDYLELKTSYAFARHSLEENLKGLLPKI